MRKLELQLLARSTYYACQSARMAAGEPCPAENQWSCSRGAQLSQSCAQQWPWACPLSEWRGDTISRVVTRLGAATLLQGLEVAPGFWSLSQGRLLEGLGREPKFLSHLKGAKAWYLGLYREQYLNFLVQQPTRSPVVPPFTSICLPSFTSFLTRIPFGSERLLKLGERGKQFKVTANMCKMGSHLAIPGVFD